MQAGRSVEIQGVAGRLWVVRKGAVGREGTEIYECRMTAALEEGVRLQHIAKFHDRVYGTSTSVVSTVPGWGDVHPRKHTSGLPRPT